MRVVYICRGYPGLGKVMGALTIHQTLASLPGYSGSFLSYDRGCAYLRAEGHACEDLLATGGRVDTDGFCAPFSEESRRAMHLLAESQATLVINDGEPYLIDLTEELLRIPTWVLAHPLDLENPANEQGVRLFRHYYRRATKVVAHGLARISAPAAALGGRAGSVEQFNTLIRTQILERVDSRSVSHDGPAVCVLGGGSSNAAGPFFQRTVILGDWFVRACADLRLRDAIVFCADHEVRDALKHHEARVELVGTPVDNSQALAGACVVVGRAGRNLASEILALGKRAVLVPITGAAFRLSGQEQTAQRASALSEAIVSVDLDGGYERFRTALATRLDFRGPSPVWTPGNAAMARALRPG